MNFSAVHSFSWFLSGKRRLNKKRKKPKTVYKNGAKNAHAFFLKQWFFCRKKFLKREKIYFFFFCISLAYLIVWMYVCWSLKTNFQEFLLALDGLLRFFFSSPASLICHDFVSFIFFFSFRPRISNLLIARQLFLHGVVISAFFSG